LEGCTNCPNGGPKCLGFGPMQSEICIVGEAPGYNEVARGRPFVGNSGQLLDSTLKEVGLNRRDIFVTNVVCCRPTTQGKDTPPSAGMVSACSERLRGELRSRRPKIVVAMGSTAAQRLLHTKDGVGKVQGVLVWSEEIQAWVLPTYHPAAVLHGGQGFFDDIWDALQRTAGLAKGTIPFPAKVYDVPYTFLQDPAGIVTMLEQLRFAADATPLEVSLDTESHGPNAQGPRPADDHWDLFQVSYGPLNGPTEATASCQVPDFAGYIGRRFREAFRKLLKHPNIKWVFHNLSYDFQVLHHNLGVVPKAAEDTMALGLCLTERGERIGLKILSRTYLNAPYYEQGLPPHVFTKGPQTQEEWDALARYGAYDAFNTRELRPILEALVREQGGYELYEKTLLVAQRAFARAEAHGASIDLEHARGLEAEWQPLVDESQRKIQAYALANRYPKDPSVCGAQQKGIPCPVCVPDWAAEKLIQSGKPRTQWREIMNARTTINDGSCPRCMKRRFVLVPDLRLNVRSPKQLQHFAFDMLGMRMPDGRRSCDVDFLAENEGHQFVTMLKELREHDHLLSAYVRGIEDDVWTDGRIHPDFLLFGTVSGRLSIRNPPVQTIPKWQVNPRLAKMVRRLFNTRPGWVVAEYDYSAIELYTAANETHDMELYKALTVPPPGYDKPDFHRVAAAAMFGKPLDEVTGKDRFNSKFVTYGVGYGRQEWSLAAGELFELTGGDPAKARLFMDRLWERFPDWKRGRDEWIRQALEEGEITTCFGRKRRWRLVTPALVGAIKNQASSFVPQSTASDICLGAFCKLTHSLPEQGLGHTLFPVHDSVVCEHPEDRLDEAVKHVVEVMTTPPPQIWTTLRVDVQVGKTLGDVEDYELLWHKTVSTDE
jgi:uracil-DNA glycosylase family 4